MNATCFVPNCSTGSRRFTAGYCSIHYWRLNVTGELGPPGRIRRRYPPGATCEVDGCSERPRVNGLCPMHSDRLRYGLELGGAAPMRAPKGSGWVGNHGYREVFVRDHPLAGARGRVLEHRVVLYDQIGEGPHSCCYCGREVHWHLPMSDPACLAVDHADHVRTNNVPENLRPSCHPCNSVHLGPDSRSVETRFKKGSSTVGIATRFKRKSA